ncbi:MAG: class B sortase [Eubacteriales bacterium]
MKKKNEKNDGEVEGKEKKQKEEYRMYNDVIEKGAKEFEKRRRTKNAAKNGKKNYLHLGILIICLFVFLFAASQLISIFTEYKEGADSYTAVKELALTAPEVETNQEITYDMYCVDFEQLLEINEDTVGWIMFESPEVINYPIVQSSDNTEYLTKTFEGDSNMVGTLFVDASNDGVFGDTNTIIYGHNMKDNSMFGDLSQYVEEEFYQEYPYFYLYTPDGKAAKYQVVATEVIDATDMYRYSINFESGTAYQTYINAILQTSYYDTGAQLSTSSKLLTLSTCTNDDETRYIVQGVKIEEREMIAPVEETSEEQDENIIIEEM